MTIRREPRRWRKLRSRTRKQFDLWRGEEHLAVVWLGDGGWEWVVIGHDVGSASSVEAATEHVISVLDRLEKAKS